MSVLSIDAFWDRFDDIDQEALQKALHRGIASIEQIDISDVLRASPPDEALHERARVTHRDILRYFPESLSVWAELREPVLDIKRLREAYRVCFQDGRKKIISNPYLSCVFFSTVPAAQLPAVLGNDDASVAVAGDRAIIVSRRIRVGNEPFTVMHEVVHYTLRPYLLALFGQEKTQRIDEPFTRALTVHLGRPSWPYRFSVNDFFDRSDTDQRARQLYERSKHPRDLLRLVQEAA
jgi:hypothetical protein